VARARLGDDRAFEAAQNAMVRLFARASEFEPGRPVLPWFYAVVANEVRSQQRARAANDAHISDVVEAERLPAGDDPERALLDRELRRALDQAIAALDAEAIEAIDALLGLAPRPAIAPAAFRKRVSRAYARLKLLLGGPDDE
jgi:RNA polymerase sigma-70 factor (ECF subfamily)